MTQDLWLNILDNMEPELIERTVQTELGLARAKRRPWLKWASVAACLLLCVGTLFAVAPWKREPVTIGEGVTIPQSSVNLKKPTDGMYDMPGLFIYNGRVYRHAQNVDNPALRGRYLATVTGLIDEWTKADGYVELAGTTPGKIYTVKGYDPDFMLCQTYSDGLSIFTCTTGLTVYTGEDWFGDIYRLRRELDTVVCENGASYTDVLRQQAEMGAGCQELIRRLVDALYEAPLMYTADVPREGTYDASLNENRLYHLEMTLKNGIKLKNLTLWRGGYLTHGAIAVKLDEALYEELLTALGELCGVPWYVESGDILACTGEDIWVEYYALPGNIQKAEVQSKISWYGAYRAPAPLDAEGTAAVYRLIDELRDTSAVHQDEMLAHEGWKSRDDGMWYWVTVYTENDQETLLILYEGGWVGVGHLYPLTFRAEGEAFDALWSYCQQLTGNP